MPPPTRAEDRPELPEPVCRDVDPSTPPPLVEGEPAQDVPPGAAFVVPDPAGLQVVDRVAASGALWMLATPDSPDESPAVTFVGRVDGRSGWLDGWIALSDGCEPAGIEFDGQALWVMECSPAGEDAQGQLNRVDPETRKITRVAVPGECPEVFVAGSGGVLVGGRPADGATSAEPETLWRVVGSGSDLELVRVDLGSWVAVRELGVDTDGSVWLDVVRPHSIAASRVDPATGDVLAVVDDFIDDDDIVGFADGLVWSVLNGAGSGPFIWLGRPEDSATLTGHDPRTKAVIRELPLAVPGGELVMVVSMLVRPEGIYMQTSEWEGDEVLRIWRVSTSSTRPELVVELPKMRVSRSQFVDAVEVEIAVDGFWYWDGGVTGRYVVGGALPAST